MADPTVNRALTGIRFGNGENYQAAATSNTTYSLEIQGGSSQVAGPVLGGLYHIANTVACYIVIAPGANSASDFDMLLMPGERQLVIPDGSQIAVAGQTGFVGGADSNFRATRLV